MGALEIERRDVVSGSSLATIWMRPLLDDELLLRRDFCGSWPAVVAATPAPEATRTTAATHGARSAPRRPAGAGSSTRFTAAAAF